VKKSKLNERSRLVSHLKEGDLETIWIFNVRHSLETDNLETSFVSVVTLARRIHTPKKTIFDTCNGWFQFSFDRVSSFALASQQRLLQINRDTVHVIIIRQSNIRTRWMHGCSQDSHCLLNCEMFTRQSLFIKLWNEAVTICWSSLTLIRFVCKSENGACLQSTYEYSLCPFSFFNSDKCDNIPRKSQGNRTKLILC
jgi:hypothetical protein